MSFDTEVKLTLLIGMIILAITTSIFYFKWRENEDIITQLVAQRDYYQQVYEPDFS